MRKLTVRCLVRLAYVLQVKVEMELEIQQYEKAKAVREEQLDRLTQICQEQAVRHPMCLLSLAFLSLHFITACNQQRAAKCHEGKSKLNLYSKRDKRCLQNGSHFITRLYFFLSKYCGYQIHRALCIISAQSIDYFTI